MLSYKEYRSQKLANNSNKGLVFEDIDNLFKSWTNEVIGLIVSPQYTEDLINFCENAVFSENKWKTIQEHRMIQQLPAIIRETLEEECSVVRLTINEAKYKIKEILKEGAEASINPFAQLQHMNSSAASSIEKEVEAIFQQLKLDLINQYTGNRGMGPSPQQPGPSGPLTPISRQKKPGLWDRTKNWLKGVWQGATGGDPNLRKFALSKGYASDPRYQHDPHAWKDQQKHPEFFPHESELAELENLFKEQTESGLSRFNSVFSKHKKALLDLISKYVLPPGVHFDPKDAWPPWPIGEPETPPKDLKRVDTHHIKTTDLQAAIKNKSSDGTYTFVSKDGDSHIVKMTDETGKEGKYIILKGENSEVRILKKKWETAERVVAKQIKKDIADEENQPWGTVADKHPDPTWEDEGQAGDEAEDAPKEPKGPEPDLAGDDVNDFEDDAESGGQETGQYVEDDPDDEDNFDDGVAKDDDSETGGTSDFIGQSGMGEIDPNADDFGDDDDGPGVEWLKQQEEPAEPEKEEEPEEKLSPQEIVDAVPQTKKVNSKKINKDGDKLTLDVWGKTHNLKVYHDPEDEDNVYLYYKKKDGGHVVKHMEIDDFNDLMGVNSAAVPEPTVTKTKRKSEPKESKPKSRHISKEDLRAHGRELEELL